MPRPTPEKHAIPSDVAPPSGGVSSFQIACHETPKTLPGISTAPWRRNPAPHPLLTQGTGAGFRRSSAEWNGAPSSGQVARRGRAPQRPPWLLLTLENVPCPEAVTTQLRNVTTGHPCYSAPRRRRARPGRLRASAPASRSVRGIPRDDRDQVPVRVVIDADCVIQSSNSARSKVERSASANSTAANVRANATNALRSADMARASTGTLKPGPTTCSVVRVLDSRASRRSSWR